MKIVVLNFASYPPSYGPRYRTHILAEEWVKAGHEVQIVCATNCHLASQDYLAGEYIENGVKYLCLRALAYRNSGLRRFFYLVQATVSSLIFAWTHKESCDVVIAASVYQTDNWAASVLAKRWRAVFVRDTRDLWPLTLTTIGKMSQKHPLVILIAIAEQRGIKRANLMVTTLNGSRDYFISKGLPGKKWMFSTQVVSQVESLQVVSENTWISRIASLKSTGKQILMFTGTKSGSTDFNTILKALKSLDNWVGVFIGEGDEETILSTAMQEMPDKVLNIPRISQSEVQIALSMTDVAWTGIPKSQLYDNGISPNKLYQYALLSKPILLAADCKGTFVEEFETGMVVPSEDVDATVSALKMFGALSVDEKKRMGTNGHYFVTKHCSPEIVSESYIQAIEQIMLSQDALRSLA
jgi:hypothetical protein